MKLTLEPIGYLRSSQAADNVRFLVSRQPPTESETTSVIELNQGCHLDAALCDLEGFSRIWLVWWFHLNPSWRPKVLPPRGPRRRRGVLATRSPHRPNPIGLSSVPLLGVSGHRILVGPHDLLDGTPILDIKPYLSSVDSFPCESRGWLDIPTLNWQVTYSPLAQTQIDWLNQSYHPNFGRRIQQVLSQDPTPCKSRRIAALPNQGFRLGCGPWRVHFRSHGEVIQVEKILSRFPEGQSDDPVHQGFYSRFGSGT